MKRKAYILVLILTCICTRAHEDPSDVIDALTHEIEKTKDDKLLAVLYLKRAIEYRAKRSNFDNRINIKRSLSDLQKSLSLNPQSFEAQLRMGQFLKGPLAKDSLDKALNLAKSDKQKSKTEEALAEHFYSAERIGEAYIHCDKAIAHDKENDLSLTLFKSHLLWKLEKLDERVTFLTKSLGNNASAVLINAWIDAHIDNGKGNAVKKIITKEMNDSRFKSSWLIRLALCEKGPAVRVYAQQAVTEIKTRLNLDRPDVTLLMDLARAYSILGEQDKAGVYANRAKRRAHDKWAMVELEAKIKLASKSKK